MPDPVSSTVGIVSKGVDLLDKMGILVRLRNKLLSNPDIAAAKLAQVLADLGQTYQIVDDTLVGFASLTFEDANAKRDALQMLNRARGGSLAIAMMDARAHCDKIWYIYDRYLQGWFSRVLKNKRQENELQSLFSELGRSDFRWVDMLGSIADGMQRISESMIICLEKGDVEGARAKQREVVKEFRALQTRLGNGLVKLQKLKREFSAITGGMDV